MGGLLLTCLFCSSLLIPSLSLAQEGEQKVPATAEESPAPVPEPKEEAPSTPAQAPATAPAEGKQIKIITLTELRGMLSDKYRGKVVILNFFLPAVENAWNYCRCWKNYMVSTLMVLWSLVSPWWDTPRRFGYPSTGLA